MKTLDIAIAWRAAREARLAKQKEVEELEIKEKKLKQEVIAALSKSKNKAVSNGERLFQLKTTMEPVAEDWAALYEHVRKTGEFELLFRRINPASVKERWEQGLTVPGVNKIPVETLSDTKAK